MEAVWVLVTLTSQPCLHTRLWNALSPIDLDLSVNTISTQLKRNNL